MTALTDSVDVVVLAEYRSPIAPETLAALEHDRDVTGRVIIVDAVARAREWRREVDAPLVAFVVSGDRFLPTKLAQQAQALATFVNAGLTHTGYRRFTRRGAFIDEIRARSTFQHDMFMVTPTSAIMLRAELLDECDWSQLAAAGCASPLWGRLAALHGSVGIDTTLVEVVVDDRDALAGTRCLGRQAAILETATRSESRWASVHRREVLSRAYLDVEEGLSSDNEQLDEPDYPDERAVADAEWALERREERRAAEARPRLTHLPELDDPHPRRTAPLAPAPLRRVARTVLPASVRDWVRKVRSLR